MFENGAALAGSELRISALFLIADCKHWPALDERNPYRSSSF
jgi:hypothetical protein